MKRNPKCHVGMTRTGATKLTKKFKEIKKDVKDIRKIKAHSRRKPKDAHSHFARLLCYSSKASVSTCPRSVRRYKFVYTERCVSARKSVRNDWIGEGIPGIIMAATGNETCQNGSSCSREKIATNIKF